MVPYVIVKHYSIVILMYQSSQQQKNLHVLNKSGSSNLLIKTSEALKLQQQTEPIIFYCIQKAMTHRLLLALY